MLSYPHHRVVVTVKLETFGVTLIFEVFVKYSAPLKKTKLKLALIISIEKVAQA